MRGETWAIFMGEGASLRFSFLPFSRQQLSPFCGSRLGLPPAHDVVSDPRHRHGPELLASAATNLVGVSIPAVFKFSSSDQIGAWNARLRDLPSFGSAIGINPENRDPIYLPRSFL